VPAPADTTALNAGIFVFRRPEAFVPRTYGPDRYVMGVGYDELISHLHDRLIATRDYASIFMDGNGSDPTYLRAHRNLPLAGRRVLEDPLFQLSHVSQWVQMADLVAWTTYQSILQHPGKALPAGWYDKHLRFRDVNGGPIAL
jgi:hypothetical protein